MNSPHLPAVTPTSALRVLVVDDMPDMCQLAKVLLTRRGANVVTADGGESALQLLEQRQDSPEPIDLVLSDFMMPMNGGELLRRVRARYPGLPVVIYSAAMTPELHDQLIADGAGDALDKGALTSGGAQRLLDSFARFRAEAAALR